MLRLPIELLQHIDGYLGNRDLLSLRLTCKELEHSTFDHFAAEFLAYQYCSIHEVRDWTHLHDLFTRHSRLQRGIQEVGFIVSNPSSLSDPSCKSLDPLKFAGNIKDVLLNMDWSDGGKNALSRVEDTYNSSLMVQVLRAVKSTGCLTWTEVEWQRFYYNLESEDEKVNELFSPVRRDFLLALATVSLPITTIELQTPTCGNFEDLLLMSGGQSLSIFGSVETFDFETWFPTHLLGHGAMDSDFRMATIIAETACNMERFTLSLIHTDGFDAIDEESHANVVRIADDLLSCKGLDQLLALNLESVSLSLDALFGILSRNKASLGRLSLYYICLFGPDDSWEQILRLISEMKDLSSLCLSSLERGHERSYLRVRFPGTVEDWMVEWVFSDRDEVKRGLDAMLDVGLEFTQEI